MADTPNPIVLYDGVCGLCNRTVQFILKRDTGDRFRFAPLQSEFGRRFLEKAGPGGAVVESVCLVMDSGQSNERVLTRSAAVIAILSDLGTFWRAVSVLLAAVPAFIRDWAYDAIAQWRYRIFGMYESCPVPAAEFRQKFLDCCEKAPPT